MHLVAGYEDESAYGCKPRSGDAIQKSLIVPEATINMQGIRLERTPLVETKAWATPHYAHTLTRINVYHT